MAGLSYPLKSNGQGGIVLAEGVDLARSHVRQLLDTRKLERVLQPEFGLDLQLWSSSREAGVAAERTRLELARWVPEVKSSVEGGYSNRRLELRVIWRVFDTQETVILQSEES